MSCELAMWCSGNMESCGDNSVPPWVRFPASPGRDPKDLKQISFSLFCHAFVGLLRYSVGIGKRGSLGELFALFCALLPTSTIFSANDFFLGKSCWH